MDAKPRKDCPVCAEDIPKAARYCTHCESYLLGWRQILNIGPILLPMIVAIVTALATAATILHWPVPGK